MICDVLNRALSLDRAMPQCYYAPTMMKVRFFSFFFMKGTNTALATEGVSA
jgi:hypothetical protein